MWSPAAYLLDGAYSTTIATSRVTINDKRRKSVLDATPTMLYYVDKQTMPLLRQFLTISNFDFGLSIGGSSPEDGGEKPVETEARTPLFY